MVKHPKFKLIAGGNDITSKVANNLVSLSYEDRIGTKSDEISFVVSGLFARPEFGGTLELWLGYEESGLYKCGKFAVSCVTRDFVARTTEIRGTAVDFASVVKARKSRTWSNTSVFAIAKTIASENGWKFKQTGEDESVSSKIQNNTSDIEFINSLCFDTGFFAVIKGGTLVVARFEGGEAGKVLSSVGNGAKKMPKLKFKASELYSLEVSEATRASYTAVEVSWQDVESGERKSVKVGSGAIVYKQNIAEPKSEREAFVVARAKLARLQSAGLSGRWSCVGCNVVAGGRVEFEGIRALAGREYNVLSVSHRLDASGYICEGEFSS